MVSSPTPSWPIWPRIALAGRPLPRLHPSWTHRRAAGRAIAQGSGCQLFLVTGESAPVVQAAVDDQVDRMLCPGDAPGPAWSPSGNSRCGDWTGPGAQPLAMTRVALIPGGARWHRARPRLRPGRSGLGRGDLLSHQPQRRRVPHRHGRGSGRSRARPRLRRLDARGLRRSLRKSVIAWRGRVDALIYCAGPFHRIDLSRDPGKIGARPSRLTSTVYSTSLAAGAWHDAAALGPHNRLRYCQCRSPDGSDPDHGRLPGQGGPAGANTQSGQGPRAQPDHGERDFTRIHSHRLGRDGRPAAADPDHSRRTDRQRGRRGGGARTSWPRRPAT